MRAELRDSLEFLYPDSVVRSPPVRAASLDVAQNGTAAVHVLLNDLHKGSTLRMSVRRSNRINKTAQWFRLIDVPVEQNTGLVGYCEKEEVNPFVTRRAPFRVYDAMQPIGMGGRTEVLDATGTVAFRLHLRPGARIGTQRHTITVSDGSATGELTLDVRTHGVRLPPNGARSLPNTNWFSLDFMARDHALRPWSPEHWRMIRRYADLMAHARQNMFWLPLEWVFEARAGKVVLNKSRLRRLVALFTNAGLHFIEGGQLALFSDGWRGATFDVRFRKGVRATSAEGECVLADLARQLREEIDKQGWRPRWLQHVADEPSEHNVADFRLLCGMIRRHLPGIPLMDAMDLTPETAPGALDVWIPKSTGYQRHRRTFDAARERGDKVWVYTCCYPGGPWLNRLLDMELLRPCLMGWAIARYDLQGYLHWGLNHHRGKGPNPALTSSCVVQPDGWVLPAGDTHMVYPGPDGPWSSVRLEAQREGFEDYELLRILRRRDAATADAILKGVIQSFKKYTKDSGRLRAARRELLLEHSGVRH